MVKKYEMLFAMNRNKLNIERFNYIKPWILKTLCEVKEARHKRPQYVWLHLYKISEKANSQRQSRLVISKKHHGRKQWKVSTNGYGTSLGGGDENIVTLESDNHCTTLWIYLNLLNCTL